MAEAGTYEVERSTVVNAPPERVYEWLDDFRRWREWSPWEDIDPDMERTFDGPGSGVGAGYAWRGNRKAGAGRMEITEAESPNELAIRLDFTKPFKSNNSLRFTLVRDGGTTRVRWLMVGPTTFMTRVMGVFTSMDKMVGPDFEKGLARLKAAAER